MGWSHRSAVAPFATPSPNPFQRKGETMSLNNALVHYGLTREQVQNANPPIPCQWRSCHGNPYAVVKRSDMEELKRRIHKQQEEAEEKALIEKHGVEGLAKMRREEQERQDRERARAHVSLVLKTVKNDICNKITELFSVSDGVFSPTLQGLQLPKTRAKSEWCLSDHDLESLSPDKVGRSLMYNVLDLVVLAERKHGRYARVVKGVLDKLKSDTSRQQYARYLKDKLDAELSKHDQELVDEACQQAKNAVKKEVAVSEVKVRNAEAQVVVAKENLVKKQNRCRSIDQVSFSGSVGRKNPQSFGEENVSPSSNGIVTPSNHLPHKKLKLAHD